MYMKLIVFVNTNKVLGVLMCGEDAPEIIQVCMFSLVVLIPCVVKMHPRLFRSWIYARYLCEGFYAVKAGLTKQIFDPTIDVHPKAAEELVTMRNPTRKDWRDTAGIHNK